MKPTKDLFELIQSLNKTEKRYFKRFSALHVHGEKNRYLLLFDAIAKQKKHDEEKLKRQFLHERFARQFPVAKNYLYQQILKALRYYHRSIHSEVKDLLRNAEILYEKGLYEQSHKAIKKAKLIGNKNEMPWTMLEIYRHWEMNVATIKNDMGWIKRITAENANELKLMQNTETYRELYYKMALEYNTQGRARNKQSMAQMKKIITSKWLQKESSALTFESKYRFFNTHVFYWNAKGNANNLYKYTKKTIDLFHKHPQKIQFNFGLYLAYAGDFIAGAVNLKKYNQAEWHLTKLKESAGFVKSLLEKVNFFFYYYYLLLECYNNTARFADAVVIIPDIKRELKTYENHLSELKKAVLFTNIALAFFGAGEHHQCLSWLNRIRNEISLSVQPGLDAFIRVFYLIVHYEAGSYDLLPYLIQSVYRFLKKKERLYKFESIFIHFLRNEVPKASTQKELIQAFQNLKTQLTPLEKDPYEKNGFAYFDYISWLESKIENRPFAEVVKEKASGEQR